MNKWEDSDLKWNTIQKQGCWRRSARGIDRLFGSPRAQFPWVAASLGWQEAADHRHRPLSGSRNLPAEEADRWEGLSRHQCRGSCPSPESGFSWAPLQGARRRRRAAAIAATAERSGAGNCGGGKNGLSEIRQRASGEIFSGRRFVFLKDRT